MERRWNKIRKWEEEVSSHSKIDKRSFLKLPKDKPMNNSRISHVMYELQVLRIPQKLLILIRIERVDSEKMSYGNQFLMRFESQEIKSFKLLIDSFCKKDIYLNQLGFLCWLYFTQREKRRRGWDIEAYHP